MTRRLHWRYLARENRPPPESRECGPRPAPGWKPELTAVRQHPEHGYPRVGRLLADIRLLKYLEPTAIGLGPEESTAGTVSGLADAQPRFRGEHH